MAESLFDNRYRYDYIYPRGRSGETLRAVDTLNNNREVVIKRPAPNDAPPIRAGQEASILNERRALKALAGHPVLTELLGEGRFFVSGTPHQYIVMERAQGIIIADLVRDLAAQGQRLPELEMLVIIDALLDLLHTAHQKEIVYNDVDAKHLFWDRDNYHLKVIDWGNAVFLEGDTITPQGISIQSDIYQVGELLYFIVTGGGRLDIPKDIDSADFRLDFGEDHMRVHSRLQAIITRAVHPDQRRRYQSIAELRRELAEYRAPQERERNSAVLRVQDRLKQDLSKAELRQLLATIEPVLAKDPGYPPARAAYQEINDRLRDIEVSADLDAVRIYIENNNWTRALDLLRELRDKAGPVTGRLINLLQDCLVLVVEANIQPPPAVLDALELMFEHQLNSAAATLLLEEDTDEESKALMWLMAERIAARVPEILLLRPSLFRLERALRQLTEDGIITTEARAVLAEVWKMLDAVAAMKSAHLSDLRDNYRAIVDRLTGLQPLLHTMSVEYNLSNRRLPITALERATNAAMALADNMHVIGKQAVSSPSDAQGALDNCRIIDPPNPLWNNIQRMLDNLYDLLHSYQTYVPAADGSDLERWLKEAQEDLQPFMDRLFDEMLAGMIDGLAIAEKAWQSYSAAAIQGNRIGALTALANATEAVGTISPTLSGWFNQLRNVVNGATYVERHAIYGALGRALADGWEAFDRGRLTDAERLGQQAFESARSEPERFAARRLKILAQATREWVDRNGINSSSRTQTTLMAVEDLFTVEEKRIHDDFATQMPSLETYLRAMGKGLVELYTRQSTAASRILFVKYVLSGALDAHDGNLDDAEFWHQAAIKALGEYGRRHPAARELDEFISRRRDLNRAEALLNEIHSPEALPKLDAIIRQLEDNPQARLLGTAIHSLRELTAALRDWSDGEFRASATKLDNAIRSIDEAEQGAEITLTSYRGYLMTLHEAALELQGKSHYMRQTIEQKPDEPVAHVRDTHQEMVQVTTELLGEHYAATLRQWADTYEQFYAVYTDGNIRRSARLARFNELFRAMFIDRHPAYPLYRHWYDVVEASPEFPAPPTDEPVPRLEEGADVPQEALQASRYTQTPRRRGGIFSLRNLLLLGGAVIALGSIIGGLLLATQNNDNSGAIPVTRFPTATETVAGDSTTAEVAVQITTAPTLPPTIAPVTVEDFATPTIRPTATPTEAITDTPAPPTETLTPSTTPTATITPTPTATATATETLTPSNTPTPSDTPTPTLPPQGLQGQQDLLALFNSLGEKPWPLEQFAPELGGASWRLGSGATTQGEDIAISPPADLLETHYGNQAVTRIRRTEARLTLTSYNPAVVGEEDLYFGLYLQSPDDDSQRAGVHVQVVPGTNVVNLSLINGEEVLPVLQRSYNVITLDLRIERNIATGDITVFVNGAQLGGTIEGFEAEEPLLPVVFVRDGGVIVNVTSWRITLR